MADEIVRAVAAGGRVLALAAVTTDLAGDAQRRHGTFPTATAALGRALTGALLLAATLKRDERLSLELRGDGPLRGILVDATPAGAARGFVMRPGTHLPPRRGKLDVGGAVGRGTLCVMRVPLAGGSLYRSLVPIQSGEIGEDIAHYLTVSAQIPSVVGLGVFVGATGTVIAAGGYLVQALPGATDDIIRGIEAAVASAPGPSTLVRGEAGAAGVLDRILPDLGVRVLERRRVRFECRCDPERARRAVVAMGRPEITRALREDGRIEALCEFCGRTYVLTPTEAEALFA